MKSLIIIFGIFLYSCGNPPGNDRNPSEGPEEPVSLEYRLSVADSLPDYDKSFFIVRLDSVGISVKLQNHWTWLATVNQLDQFMKNNKQEISKREIEIKGDPAVPEDTAKEVFNVLERNASAWKTDKEKDN